MISLTMLVSDAIKVKKIASVLVSDVINPFLPTFPTFGVRETDVSRHNGETSGAPLKDVAYSYEVIIN